MEVIMNFKTLNFLSIDVETGGINEKENSLLEVGMVPYINNKRGPELFIKIKYENYNITAAAQKVNGWEKVEHEKTAVCPKEAFEIMKNYLKEIMKLNGNQKIMSCGRNVDFDVRFLEAFFNTYGDEKLSDYLNAYHKFDLTPIGYFLYQVNMLDILPSSSDRICNALNIEEEVKPHSAINGARINIDVYEKILEAFKNKFDIK
jgi:DNA polymerase III epsilon subunit-like protein